ncbi:sigma-54 interacting transcriptional regulator [Desulfobotulus alkaliphilus]|uniref:Sigma-54 interacting transcriptional regulator n=1 Tax=Desulfobotulus alkaliphilus TaxID=622671 RepID=A0A562S5Y2_9BACT|nr:sigma-54 dependent transcriptional regulator [Desulfobotulus alkaliphilus]TWI76751.1 sigma-54 interacting transcriptional regulator [Desulfobotulus alkaliphilus]
MNSSKNTRQDTAFIHEVTQRLYSTLQIEKALHSTLLFLREHMPADSLNAGIFDPTTGMLQYLASATCLGGMLIDERLQLSEKGIRDTEHYAIGKAHIDKHPWGTQVSGEIAEHFRLFHEDFPGFDVAGDFSTLTLTVGIGVPRFGYFNILAHGLNQFSEKHRRMMNLLERPLTGAALNLWHYRKVVTLNEHLVRTNDLLLNRLGHIAATEVIGTETGLHGVITLAKQVADTNAPVLITGETGTGKEVVAHAIHRLSRRKNHPMICINCGAIPETLMDSELFGHERGAFTGASSRKRGYFEQADGGTIFLDEVGELSAAAQVKLLRVLQEHAIRRVGGNRSIPLDVRVIAATHRNLPALAEEGRFRRDLWFRLNVFPIHIPPLRERTADIPALAEFFAARKAREMNVSEKPVFAAGAFDLLKSYHWPGNIRELENLIERSLIICQGSPLHFDNLSPSTPSLSEKREGEEEAFPSLESITIRHILKALRKSGGRIEGPGGAACLLDLNPSTLRGKIKKYGISK